MPIAESPFPWAIVTDPRAWLLILAAGAVVLGRSGLFRSRVFAWLKPWRTRPGSSADRGRASTTRPPVHPLRDPLYLFLLVVSASAVVAWIVMKMAVTSHRP